MSDSNTRQAKRTPVTLKIKFKSETLGQFIERYSVDISHGGIFIRTKNPLAVGTSLRFEFQLKDASPLITGEGTVVWTREHDPSRVGVAPGMGVRFDKLTPKSKGVLDKILSEKAAKAPAAKGSFEQGPTRVGSDAVIGDLVESSRKTSDSFADDGGDSTPLPKPIPFHTDADNFPEEAFEEATRVTDLDQLAAATKSTDIGNLENDIPTKVHSKEEVEKAIAQAKSVGKSAQAPAPKPATPKPASKPAPAKAEAAPKAPAKAKAKPTQKPASKPKDDDEEDIKVFREEQARKKAEAHARKVRTMVEAAQDPRRQALKQRLLTKQMELAGESEEDIAAAIAAQAPAAKSGGSGVWIAAGAAMLVAAAGVGYWYMSKGGDEEVVAKAETSKTEEAPSAAKTAPKPEEQVPLEGLGEGKATGQVSVTPMGATVKIAGTNESGKMGDGPFTFKGLKADKVYTIQVSFVGYKTQEVNLTGGASEPVKVTLEPVARLITIKTKPAGAKVSVNEVAQEGVTPLEITLSGDLAKVDELHVVFTKPNYTEAVYSVRVDEFTEEGDKVRHDIDIELFPKTVATGGQNAPTRRVIRRIKPPSTDNPKVDTKPDPPPVPVKEGQPSLDWMK